jgi:kynurenine formamidase
LALQVLMGTHLVGGDGTAQLNDMIDLPLGSLGVDGIYDIPALLESFNEVDGYRDSMIGAFGIDEQVWQDVSPARHNNYARSWPNGKLVMIAHSERDELVDWKQVDLMEVCWNKQETWGCKLRTLELHSTHHEV